jgi:hypothetical protein
MTITEAHSELFEKFSQYFKHIDPFVSAEQTERLFDSIEDKKWIDEVLSKHPEPSVEHARINRPNTTLLKYSVGANLRVMAFPPVADIELHADGVGKVFTGEGKGVLIGIAVSGGTLYYNDVNDLTNRCNFDANFISVSANVNFFHHLPDVFATYFGGGIPLLGEVWGKGKWS